MKKVIIFCFTILCGIGLNAQSPLFYAYANIASKAAVGGGLYDLTFSNFNGGYKMYPDANYEASDIAGSPVNFVVWAGCARFVVTQKISSSPLVLRVNDVSNTGGFTGSDLVGYRVTIGKESSVGTRNIGYFSNVADGNSGSQAGISPFDAACIENYYRTQIDTAISEASTGNGIYDPANNDDTAKVARAYITDQLTFDGDNWLNRFPSDFDESFAVTSSEMFMFMDTTAFKVGHSDGSRPYVEVGMDGTARRILLEGDNVTLRPKTGGATPFVQYQDLDRLQQVSIGVPDAVTANYNLIYPATGPSQDTMFRRYNLNGTSLFVLPSAVAAAVEPYLDLGTGLVRYSAGNGCMVTATGLGATFVRTTSSVWTLTFPTGVEPVGRTIINSTAGESATASLTVNIVFQGTRIYNQDATTALTDVFAPAVSTVEKTDPAQYPTAAAANNPSWTLDVTSASNLSLNTSEFTEVGNGGANGTSVTLDF